jgi:hypothetical protein
MRRTHIRLICGAAVLGALVPIFWSILGFVNWNAKGHWADMFWRLVYLTCPSWLLPENGLSWLITPAVNAVMYAAIAAILIGAVILLRPRSYPAN